MGLQLAQLPSSARYDGTRRRFGWLAKPTAQGHCAGTSQPQTSNKNATVVRRVPTEITSVFKLINNTPIARNRSQSSIGIILHYTSNGAHCTLTGNENRGLAARVGEKSVRENPPTAPLWRFCAGRIGRGAISQGGALTAIRECQGMSLTSRTIFSGKRAIILAGDRSKCRQHTHTLRRASIARVRRVFIVEM